MRTTIKLDKDVAAAAERLRRKEGIGLSEAVNRIARAGLVRQAKREPYEPRSAHLGELLIDVSNVAEALELAEGPEHR